MAAETVAIVAGPGVLIEPRNNVVALETDRDIEVAIDVIVSLDPDRSDCVIARGGGARVRDFPADRPT